MSDTQGTTTNAKARIAVLVSGGGTNLQALIDAEKAGILKSGFIRLVISNKKDAFALERAEKAGIEAFALTKKSCGGQEGFEKRLTEEIESRDIDLIFSGHCHGGQWRVYSILHREERGVFAPGQGLFPPLTSGLHDGRLLISRGLSNTTFIPRINNPTEIIYCLPKAR